MVIKRKQLKTFVQLLLILTIMKIIMLIRRLLQKVLRKQPPLVQGKGELSRNRIKLKLNQTIFS